MITDEQLDLLYEKHSNKYGEQSIPDDGRIEEFARELIALAQQVKPLGFRRIDKTTKKADSVFGPYFICDYIDGVRMALPEEINYYGRGYTTEAEAIEAANEDYQRRVLSCLVWGDV